MRHTALDILIRQLNENMFLGTYCQQEEQEEKLNLMVSILKQAKEMETQQLKDAYQHGRDDENCALSDGAMAPDYDNADEWYKGEYGGEK